MKNLCIGVLALQGNFSNHVQKLQHLQIKSALVRTPKDLLNCDALIIPGGESTVIQRQMDFIGLREGIIQFAKEKPIFGTCAGLILMAKNVEQSTVQPLGLLDIHVKRNAYGRQINSFQTFIEYQENKQTPVSQVPAFFIRAPRICACGPSVKVIAKFQGEPVVVQQGHLLAASFHPELTNDYTIYHYFISFLL